MKKIFLSISLLFALLAGDVMAQNGGGLYDPHLSMYQFQPLSLNPALTGNMDSKWRMSAVYREQGYTVHRPYRTFKGSLDFNLPINAWNGNIWGFGISVLNDDQGDLYLTNRRINFNFSLGQYLDAQMKHSISVGFQGGLGTRAIDYTDGYWDRQWVGEGFQVDAPSGEPEVIDVRGYADLGTGVQYTYYSGDLVEFYAGVSSYHINRPDVGFYADTASTLLQRRNNVHVQFVHRIRDNSMFAFKPSAVYSRQAQRANLMVGTDLQFLFNEGTRTTGKRNESSISFGLFGRMAMPETGTVFDFIGMMSMEFAGFTFGAGYDVPLGTFNSVNGYEGAFEFMLGYRAGYRRGLYNKYSPKRKGKL